MNMSDQRSLLAVSACLLGQPVRYDGKEKKQNLIVDFFLNRYSEAVRIIPFCPEVGIGMGVPRPKIQLVSQKDESIRVLGVENHTLDVTKALQSYAQQFIQQYPDIQFFIVKARSPSCGYHSTPLFKNPEQVDSSNSFDLGTSIDIKKGEYLEIAMTSGMFVQTLLKLKPELQIVDEIMLTSENDCLKLLQQVVS